MGKKKKYRKKQAPKQEEFGTCTFYCKSCNHHFEVDWETIFDIQEATHGYVGFHTNDVFMSCPTCDQIVENQDEEFPF